MDLVGFNYLDFRNISLGKLINGLLIAEGIGYNLYIGKNYT